ncbi:MAG: HD-GYP domain-containing protein [Chloroflexota bacterium]
MFERIHSLMAPPVFPEDEDATRSARVLNLLLLTFIFILGLVFLANFFLYVQKSLSLVFILLFFLVLVSAYLLLRFERVRQASLVFVSGLWVVTTALLILAGGAVSPIVSFYFVVVVFAGLLLGSRAALTSAALCSLAGLGMLMYDTQVAPLPRFFPVPAQAGWVDLSVGLFLITVTLNIALRDLKAALSHAHEQLLRRKQAEQDLQKTHQELVQAYEETLAGWGRALEISKFEVAGHGSRVVDLTVQLARQMGVPESDLIHVQRGALLHDIGKIAVPNRILDKPGPLNDEEWAIMHQHPTYAQKMLAGIAFLQPALDIPVYHHEKWDGTGYPQGLSGERIPLAARIFAIIDMWDALISERPYRRALPPEQALALIRQESGSRFDPAVVAAFMQAIQNMGKDQPSPTRLHEVSYEQPDPV